MANQAKLESDKVLSATTEKFRLADEKQKLFVTDLANTL